MKNTIVGIIIGVAVTITSLSVWQVISINSRVSTLEVFATQVASIINNASKAQTK